MELLLSFFYGSATRDVTVQENSTEKKTYTVHKTTLILVPCRHGEFTTRLWWRTPRVTTSSVSRPWQDVLKNPCDVVHSPLFPVHLLSSPHTHQHKPHTHTKWLSSPIRGVLLRPSFVRCSLGADAVFDGLMSNHRPPPVCPGQD